jgi:hypothetical protein
MIEKPACFRCKSTTRKLKLVPGTKTMVGCAECIRARRNERRLQGRERRQKAVYGLTLEEAKAIEAIQDGGCICAPWTNYDGSGGRSLSTDHDHKTGEVRGRLCKHCNDLLGRIKDDPTYFRLMIRYLEDPPARKVVGVRVVPGHEGVL